MFVVVVVILEKDEVEEVTAFCETIEGETGKGKAKWGKASYPRRLAYMSRIVTSGQFRHVLRFKVFPEKVDRDDATIKIIARSIQWSESSAKYESRVYVDALSKNKRHEYSAALRHLGVSTDKVQGVRKDENNALIRLADALAGFICDVLGDDIEELIVLFRQANDNGVLIEV